MKKICNLGFWLLAFSFWLLSSCEKVSPIGILVSGTGVEDRVKMSNQYFLNFKNDYKMLFSEGDYTFLVGADSHLTNDTSRMAELFDIGINGGDLLITHLGDIADTKPEYYINLEETIMAARKKYARKYYVEQHLEDYSFSETIYMDPEDSTIYDLDDIIFPFYPVVGNHDITHNGWAMWSNIFHSSFYEVYVFVGDLSEIRYDRFIFLDTASGTLGREQVKLIEEGVFDDEEFRQLIRHTFVFGHTNIFRPRSLELASTFPREELYFLINKFQEWKASIVFCGHVHKWDDHVVGDVQYLTLDSMCEENNPESGDYLVRVHVKKDGTLSWEKVHMNTRKK